MVQVTKTGIVGNNCDKIKMYDWIFFDNEVTGNGKTVCVYYTQAA
jgi:hypothetical protein